MVSSKQVRRFPPWTLSFILPLSSFTLSYVFPLGFSLLFLLPLSVSSIPRLSSTCFPCCYLASLPLSHFPSSIIPRRFLTLCPSPTYWRVVHWICNCNCACSSLGSISRKVFLLPTSIHFRQKQKISVVQNWKPMLMAESITELWIQGYGNRCKGTQVSSMYVDTTYFNIMLKFFLKETTSAVLFPTSLMLDEFFLII